MDSIVQQIAFPHLSSRVLQIDRIAFTIFGIPVYWYGIIIAIGFMLALVYFFCRHKTFGLNADRCIDVIIGGAIAGIIGARLYYVAFEWDYYGSHLGQIFDTRSGGLAIYGGVIGAFGIGVLLCRWRKVKTLPMLDVVATGFLIGQGVGRWGNFVNVEAFGGITSMPWGMASPEIYRYLGSVQEELNQIGMEIDLSYASSWMDVTVHPTFFYESVWCLLGFLLLALYTAHRRFDGELALMYAVWYGLGRSVIEGLRTDSLMLGSTGLRASQMLAIILAATASIIWIVVRMKIKKNGSDYLPLYVGTEESRQALSGELYKKDNKTKS